MRNQGKELEQIRKVLLTDDEAVSDSSVLERFISSGDELALEALVVRYAPMVWGVCWRLLADHHDAEDAFQATFLVLVRRARSIEPRHKVGSWLYGVAHQTALKGRAMAAKRKSREKQTDLPPEAHSTQPPVEHELLVYLDLEISRLPEKYREPIVLCELQGKTIKAAARQLGVPDGTVAGRLARARKMLAHRLSRHVPTAGAATMAAILADGKAWARAPAPLIEATVSAACSMSNGKSVAGIVSANVLALLDGMLKQMLLIRLRSTAAIAALACLVVALAVVGLWARQRDAGQPGVMAAAPNVNVDEPVPRQGGNDVSNQPRDDNSPAPTQAADKESDKKTETRPGRRFAFLVACARYDSGELREIPGAIPQLDDFRQALVNTNFISNDVVILHDKRQRRFYSERAKIIAELKALTARPQPQDAFVLVLSGHMVRFLGDNVDYFCPLDARLGDKDTLLAMGGRDGVFDILTTCKARSKVVIVVGGPAQPFLESVNQTSLKVSVAGPPREIPNGLVALYPCSSGQANEFERSGSRSIFFNEVIQSWNGRYNKGAGPQTLEELADQVRRNTTADVQELFSVVQTPAVLGKASASLHIRESLARSGKEIENSLGMKLVRIEAGSFTMGFPKSSKFHQKDKSEHEVEIPRPFYIGKYEVTQAEYRAVMGKASSQHLGDRLPVDKVTWFDAKEFCARLSKKEGREYTLPTEAEWEYACRAGTKTLFNCGDTVGEDSINCTGLFDGQKLDPRANNRQSTMQVGSFPPNAWGLHDMHGNVQEWCEDWHAGDYYDKSPKVDPRGPAEGQWRIVRGGSFAQIPIECSSAFRIGSPPDSTQGPIGFRVVLRFPLRSK